MSSNAFPTPGLNPMHATHQMQAVLEDTYGRGISEIFILVSSDAIEGHLTPRRLYTFVGEPPYTNNMPLFLYFIQYNWNLSERSIGVEVRVMVRAVQKLWHMVSRGNFTHKNAKYPPQSSNTSVLIF